jgi:hypothetical protein
VEVSVGPARVLPDHRCGGEGVRSGAWPCSDCAIRKWAWQNGHEDLRLRPHLPLRLPVVLRLSTAVMHNAGRSAGPGSSHKPQDRGCSISRVTNPWATASCHLECCSGLGSLVTASLRSTVRRAARPEDIVLGCKNQLKDPNGFAPPRLSAPLRLPRCSERRRGLGRRCRASTITRARHGTL